MDPEIIAAQHKVLVVDDDQVIVKMIVTKLTRAGYKAFGALDGSEAIAIVRKEMPDLIILDINFPPETGGVPWDGYSLMEWLRRMEESKKIPIIIITGDAGHMDMERAVNAGSCGILFKPLDYDELLRLVKGVGS